MFKHLLPGIALAILALAPFPVQGAPSSKDTVVFDHVLPNVPGKSMRGVLVEYPPGGTSAAHTHPHSAFIYATVLEGAIKSQVNDGPDHGLYGRPELRRTARRPSPRQRKRQRYPARAPPGRLRRGYRRDQFGHRRRTLKDRENGPPPCMKQPRRSPTPAS